MKIISGGQTGVDQAALRAAQDCGLETGGWCPPGRLCETGLIPDRFPLQETPEDRSPLAPAPGLARFRSRNRLGQKNRRVEVILDLCKEP